MKHLRLLVCALLALLAFLVYVIVKTVSLDGIQGLMLDQPLLGPLALIFIMATAVVIVPVPNLPWDFLAGATYGPFIGTLLVLLGGTLGAGIAFTIAKHVGKPLLEKIFKTDLDICPHCYDKALFWFILVSRAVPVLQFDIVSYAAGITTMSLRSFLLATFVGMIPSAIVLASTGSVIKEGNTILIAILSFVAVGLLFLLPRHLKKHLHHKRT